MQPDGANTGYANHKQTKEPQILPCHVTPKQHTCAPLSKPLIKITSPITLDPISPHLVAMANAAITNATALMLSAMCSQNHTAFLATGAFMRRDQRD